MDPRANLARQHALAAAIIALGDSLPDDEATSLLANAYELATLVLTLDEWRVKGGYDPYHAAERATPGLHRVAGLLLDETEQPQTIHELGRLLLTWVDGPIPVQS